MDLCVGEQVIATHLCVCEEVIATHLCVGEQVIAAHLCIGEQVTATHLCVGEEEDGVLVLNSGRVVELLEVVVKAGIVVAAT